MRQTTEVPYNATVQTLGAGTLVHDRYRIIRPVGRGGMGAVYEAIDARLLNTVAVKQMTITGDEADQAFEREAKLLAGLRHPALPVVVDYFVDTHGQYLVMQYIEGEDLGRLLTRQGGAFGPEDLVEWARAVLDVLSYLHGHYPPIVHRDIKPANVKRTPRGEIVLLDFGLAKGRISPLTSGPNEDRSLFGFTLKYAPLEQIEGRGTDPRSDLYALSATLYHLATGIPPPSAPERSSAVRNGRPDPLVDARVINPRLGASFSAMLTHGLGLEPAERFSSAFEMHAALLNDAPENQGKPSRRDPAASPRRIDAAIPSQVVVGKQVDLIVQVRFAESPLLGLEDWPTRRRRPAEIEQGSEPLPVAYPVDPRTGALMPARIRIKVVAPDFRVESQAEHLIEVPPDEYSRRLAFLLTSLRAGFCRVNVEVYGPQALYLGTVPVEAEAIEQDAAQPTLRVANLALGVFAGTVKKADSHDNSRTATALPGIQAYQDDRGHRTAAGPDDDTVRPLAIQVLPTPRSNAQLLASARLPEKLMQPGPSSRGGRSRWRSAALFAPLMVLVIGAGIVMLQRSNSPGPLPTPVASGSVPRAESEPLSAGSAPTPTVAGGPPPSALGLPPPSASAELAQVAPPPPSDNAVSLPPASAIVPSQLEPTKAVAPVSQSTKVPPPQSPEEFAKGKIQDALKAYCAAHEALDPQAVQRVWRTANVDALRRQFSAYKSVQCKFGDPVVFVSLDPLAGKATVKAELKLVYDPKVGAEQVDEKIADLTVSRPNPSSGWYIDKAAFKPKPK